jgi:uncharacterized protein YceH (UPF0502 family)
MEDILTFEEIRVIGSLIEKELTTPEYYPLTINGLKNACNQKSNRDPVVAFDENIIETTLDKLREKSLASRITGSDIRVPKYRQVFTEAMHFSPEEVAVICVLMLRGPQTPGEIKSRSGRMFNFESLAQLDEVIQNLMNREKPLVMKLPRQTGMKESRYMHLLSGEAEIEVQGNQKVETTSNDDVRIINLETELESLKNEVNELKAQFEKFKHQFE